jgi:riboflavin kinase/FMN adenylyltransferase
MKIFDSISSLQGQLRAPVLTIGNFDGVHKGHLVLFNKVKERAKAIGGESVVMTFDPHPIKILKPGNGPPLITPTEQKKRLIEAAQIDALLCMPFSENFATMTAEDFVKEILIEAIGVREIVVGYDYRFGYKQLGNIDLLKKMGDTYQFKVHKIGPIQIDDLLVSSTSVRRFVQEGHLSKAEKLLGRNYQIAGTVVAGKNRGGKLLGFPTANLKVMDELIPAGGVYAVTVFVDGKTYKGVTNIGVNPTFGENTLSVETHLLDYRGDLLGKEIRINFIQRLRKEKAFKSIHALSQQIGEDIEKARECFEQRHIVP